MHKLQIRETEPNNNEHHECGTPLVCVCSNRAYLKVVRQNLEFSHLHLTLQRVDPFLGNNLKTNNQTTSAAKEQILNKQVYAAVAG
jgi:hypothetical protein